MKTGILAASLAATILAAGHASAVTREEVLIRARAYAIHEWSSTSSNQKASCSPKYKSLFPPDDYVGLPYGWGGYMSLFEFDQNILSGYAAGAQEPDGVLDCIAGVDCSGFVSKTWQTGHFTTSSIPTTSSQINKNDMLPGDVFNQAGFHVALFSNLLQSGEPFLIEAAGYNTHFNGFGGWSYVNGYIPRRFSGISGTTASNPVGTTYNPIVVNSFPFNDSRNTKNSLSTVYDGCNAAAGTPEKGPEFIYKLEITTPGTLTASVQDDAATDVDIYLLEHLNTTACLARNDTAISKTVGCGTYYLVVDSYGADSSKAGPYTLSVNVAPSGQACSAVAGPSPFNPKGKLGDACSYPGHEDLPSCNPNLGSETCIYGSSSSFCSKACANENDCSALPGGGCCQDLTGKGEFYCLTKSFCDGSGGKPGVADAGTNPTGDPSTPKGQNPDGTSGEGEGEGDNADPTGSSGNGSGGTTTTASGCSLSHDSSSSAAWGVALAGLAMVAASRRRRSR
ncbi:hypothetical protein AKJ09_07149 [Labilithrix luteola]|uniref:Peptidase C-terminal archaeal/bacterial domain-containing protein n=1 Tax=Labilithrix luteola TaxID=1391654 RepID=A0A0K1Q3S4_9BACT|nr:MYXO-CTERM sorting domain-containing protein [Labilithrix luteola]AKV00486.1 hypothetical protein AKJ09_07149 [Labilithrix luteola]